MAVTTVAQLAAELNRSAAALLEQLQSAGVGKASTADTLTDADKERLLDHLRSTHGTTGGERKKITLTRKSTSEIKQADASGKARTIQVEVRKKRTFIKRDDTPGAAPVEAPAEPVVDDAELERRELEAQAQAELLRRQEEELEEKRRQREEQLRLEREAAEQRQREAAEAAAKATAEAAASAKAAGTAAAAPAPLAAPAAAPAPAPVEPPKPVLRVIKAADVVDEEKQRAADLAKRRKAAEDEAAAIRAMMSAPKRVLTAKKPEEPPKPEAGKEGIKGTIHKAAAVPGAPGAPGAVVAKAGDKKSVKSEKLSSSWADDAAKKRGLKGRTDAPSAGARPGWRAPRGGRRGERNDGNGSSFIAPAEQQVQEVHVPETI
ncbi:MAG TPA: translation initiation factor IF-2 associated domain-containing protein, partial [Albitalea sp.]|nr:translation initiation factor IF-2 associated domain-containing protein [Albitalea sp.]